MPGLGNSLFSLSSLKIKTAQSWHISLHALCTIKAIWLGTSAEVLEFAALRVYVCSYFPSGLEKGLLYLMAMAELAFKMFFFSNIFPEPIYFSLSSATMLDHPNINFYFDGVITS